MAQGYTGYNIIDNEITIKDSPNIDSFGRLRVSNPLTIFNNQFTYDISPLIFQAVTNNAANCSVQHDTTNRLARIRFSQVAPSIPDEIYYQSYEYIPYQPGRSQLVFITFVMFPSISSPAGTCDKTVGLSDGNNGFEFVYDLASLSPAFLIRTTTAAGNQLILQANWNIDRLDGTGTSGISLDLSKPQILVIDFQALYVGRVRFGFDIDGQIIYAHEFLNANASLEYPYIATANLPIRVGMSNLGLALAEDIYFICCSVASEGGTDDAQKTGYNFVYGDIATITSTVGFEYCMQLRPRTNFNGIVNRTKFILTELEIFNSGNRSAKWQLTIGDPPSGGWNDVNTNYSAMEYATGGTYTIGTTIVIDEGYAAASGGSKSNNIVTELANRYPITLDAGGNQRDFGTLTLSAQLLSAGSSDLYFTMKWKEVR